jgi:hypothetical protein
VDRIPVEANSSADVKTDPGAHPASCTVGTRSFQGVKRVGCDGDHPTTYSGKVKARVALCLQSPYVTSLRFIWGIYFVASQTIRNCQQKSMVADINISNQRRPTRGCRLLSIRYSVKQCGSDRVEVSPSPQPDG